MSIIKKKTGNLLNENNAYLKFESFKGYET